MNVATSAAVICHRTSVGLELLADEMKEDSYRTTAWFLELLNTFFQLATARHQALGLSKRNMVAYEKAILLFKKVCHVFQNMKVGVSGEWKPCQRGMLVLIDSLLLRPGLWAEGFRGSLAIIVSINLRCVVCGFL
jgi:hypothetical protein